MHSLGDPQHAIPTYAYGCVAEYSLTVPGRLPTLARMGRADIVLTGLVVAAAASSGYTPPCRRDSSAEDWARAADSCARAFQHSRDHDDAMAWASAASQLGRLDEAERVATSVMNGPRGADARQILGSVAAKRNDNVTARVHLGAAMVLHATAANDRSA